MTPLLEGRKRKEEKEGSRYLYWMEGRKRRNELDNRTDTLTGMKEGREGKEGVIDE